MDAGLGGSEFTVLLHFGQRRVNGWTGGLLPPGCNRVEHVGQIKTILFRWLFDYSQHRPGIGSDSSYYVLTVTLDEILSRVKPFE